MDMISGRRMDLDAHSSWLRVHPAMLAASAERAPPGAGVVRVLDGGRHRVEDDTQHAATSPTRRNMTAGIRNTNRGIVCSVSTTMVRMRSRARCERRERRAACRSRRQ